MSQSSYALASVLLASTLLVTACGGGGSSSNVSPTPTPTPTPAPTPTPTPVPTPTVNLTIPFKAVAGTTEINCAATLFTLGNTGDSGKISDFAFYIHDVKLKTSDGKLVALTLTDNNFQDPQYGVALLDFQDRASCDSTAAAKVTNTSVTGTATIDISKVTGIDFIVGVPSAANHHNASVSRAPYNRAGLAWSWQSGHKFMRLDVKPTQGVTKADTSKVATFNFHLGSTGCTGDATTGQVVSCTAPNRPTISLTQDFSVNSTTNKTSTVVLDYAKLIMGVNINLETGGAVGCMSGATDPECPAMFSNLGLAHPLATSGSTPIQQVFSVSNN